LANSQPWASNEFDLGGPSADGRPAPVERTSSASAKADAWRAAPREADFNRRESRTSFASAKADARRAAPWEADFNQRESLRPTVGLRRPKRHFCVGEGRRLARQRLERPISIGASI